MHESDKSYWHRYLEFYEHAFARLTNVSTILEFGVFRGDSIRWLAERFPAAQIVGCDITPQQPSWPVSPRIGYVRLDQGSPDQIQGFFRHFKIEWDLVIEDGSHHPVHQRNCLVEALPYVRAGGLYVLEDIHSSHPSHTLYRSLERPGVVGPLQLLLGLEHVQSNGGAMTDEVVDRLTADSLFSRDDVARVAGRTKKIDFYRRATLPHRCYNCGTSRFDFGSLRCACGAELYDEADSMSAILYV